MKYLILIFLIFSLFDTYSQNYAIGEKGLKIAVKLENDNGNVIGSGFFYDDSLSVHLVTAKHVLLTVKNKRIVPKGGKIVAKYFNRESLDDISSLEIELDSIYSNSNLVKFNQQDDLIAIKIGSIDIEQKKIAYSSYIVPKGDKGKFDIIPARHSMVKKFDDILYGTETWIMGYPESLHLVALDQYDFNVPLLRRGVIAGKYDKKKTIVIDCPSFPGNSGGPVFNYLNRNEYNIIGIVVEFIPFAEYWTNQQYKIINTEFSNSGYSIVEPMDKLINLLNN